MSNILTGLAKASAVAVLFALAYPCFKCGYRSIMSCKMAWLRQTVLCVLSSGLSLRLARVDRTAPQQLARTLQLALLQLASITRGHILQRNRRTLSLAERPSTTSATPVQDHHSCVEAAYTPLRRQRARCSSFEQLAEMQCNLLAAIVLLVVLAAPTAQSHGRRLSARHVQSSLECRQHGHDCF